MTQDNSIATAVQSPKRDRYIGHANLMSALTILSRVFGLIRDKACSHFLGAGTVWGAFWMGFQLPNLFRRIFGEGALTAIFVPTYTRILQQRGQAEASRLASATCTLLITFLGAVTVLGELIVIPFALSPNAMPSNQLAAAMIAIMLPYCVLVCVVALLGAMASVHEKFTAQSLSPIILNAFMTLAAGLSVWLMGKDYSIEKRITWVAISVVVSGMVQVLQMLPTISRSGIRLRAVFDTQHSGVREIISAMIPMMIGLSAVQTNTYMDTQIAWWLSPDGHGGAHHFNIFGHMIHVAMEDGALGKLSIAQRMYLLPVGIFGVAMATAIFPHLSRAATNNDMPEVKRLLMAALRKTLFLSLPASAGMILIAKPLITLIYMSGKVSPAEVDRAAWATDWFCGGIWAFEAQLVLLRVFYALRDVKTPMKVAVCMVLLNLGLNLCLVWPLKEGGIAASTTIAAIIQSALLLWILRRRLGALGISALQSSVCKGLLATGMMVAVAWYVGTWLPQATPDDRHSLIVHALINLPIIVSVAALTYAGAALALRMPELFDLPLISRFKRAQ